MTAGTMVQEKRGRGRPLGSRSPRSQAIGAYLREHYPAGILPYSVIEEAAERFGVTMGWIRKIAKANGYRWERKPQTPGRSQAIEAYLQEHYPCQAVPR